MHSGVVMAIDECDGVAAWAGVADLCGAGWHRLRQGVQRPGGERNAAQSGAEGTLCERGDMGRDGFPNCEYVGAGGGGDSIYAATGRGDCYVERRADCVL